MSCDPHGHLRLHLDRPLKGRERRDLLAAVAADHAIELGISPIGRIIDIRPALADAETQVPETVVNFLVNSSIGFRPNMVVSLKAA
jgi:hypothetical protein